MDKNFAIRVSKVSKSFRLPHEKVGSIKNLILNVFKFGNRTFETQQVLKNVSLEIKPGDFFGIVGKNGGGKSTMLKLLAGIYTPNQGAIEVNGKLTAFIELGVGFNPELTGRDNVYLSGALLGFSEAQVNDMYDDIVSFAELDKFMDQKLKNYSSGMQVRLAFSIAIRARSDILILDEVLAVGDAAFQQKCYNYFEELKSSGKTVVFVSHDMGAVKRFCNRAAYIRGGKVVKVGTPENISLLYIEDNIALTVEETTTPETSIAHRISYKLGKRTATEQEIIVSYESKDDIGMYVGLSICRDGMTLGEIASSYDKPLTGNGTLRYVVQTNYLNPGIYYFSGVSLFQLSNRQLLAFSKEKREFQVKGNDSQRGSAFKLPDTWSYDGN